MVMLTSIIILLFDLNDIQDSAPILNTFIYIVNFVTHKITIEHIVFYIQFSTFLSFEYKNKYIYTYSVQTLQVNELDNILF